MSIRELGVGVTAVEEGGDRTARLWDGPEEARDAATAFLDAVSQLGIEMGVRGVVCAVAMQFDGGVPGLMVHVGARIEAEGGLGLGLAMAVAKAQAAGGLVGWEPAAGGLIQ